MSEQLVLVSDDGPVRIVSLNRPALRNAIDVPLRVALAEALEDAAAAQAVRAIVLTGAGSSFCAGGDISTMRRQPPAETLPRAEAAARVVRAIWDTGKPVIAAVEGSAFGAGTALALACDRVVAGEDAVFSTSFTAVGLAGDMGIFASLPARIGPARAKQLMMLPRRLSGAEAGDLGLVDEVVPSGSALEQAQADAARLAAGPPLALGAIKAMFSGLLATPYDVLEREVAVQAELFDTDDFAEGVAAFHEKRTPKFAG